LTALFVNFRKAGANYSPLQQNHPNKLNRSSFKSSGENNRSTLNHSPASTDKQLE
jgi:hypothetical protein